jgi:small-conductance mechanosensitive channel
MFELLNINLWNYVGDVIIIILIIFLTILISKLFSKFYDKHIKKISNKKNKNIESELKFLRHLIIALIYIIGFSFIIYIIPPLRAISVSIFASAGILAVIIGFAAQQAFSNIISGIFIAIFKPFKVGDRVKLKTDLSGIVEDITLRHTIIRNFENKRFIIPNSVISSEIIENSSFGDEKICKFVEFSISYDSDIDKAMKIMREEAMKHQYFLDNRTDEEKKTKEPAVPVRLIGFSDFAVQLRAYVWAQNPNLAFKMGCDLNKNIKEQFDKHGIEIPYPYRTIVYKNEKKIKN